MVGSQETPGKQGESAQVILYDGLIPVVESGCGSSALGGAL